jgi:hypothetical protein
MSAKKMVSIRWLDTSIIKVTSSNV